MSENMDDFQKINADLAELVDNLVEQLGEKNVKGKSVLGIAVFEEPSREEVHGSYADLIKMNDEWRAKGGRTLFTVSLTEKPSNLYFFPVYNGLSVFIGEKGYIENLAEHSEGIKTWGKVA